MADHHSSQIVLLLPEQREWLRKTAFETKTSQSALVRQAIEMLRSTHKKEGAL